MANKTNITKEERRYKQQNVMAWVMFINGILMAWISAFFVDPPGEISNSVLGYVGTCFSVGGAMWGFGLWVNNTFQRKAQFQDGFQQPYPPVYPPTQAVEQYKHNEYEDSDR